MTTPIVGLDHTAVVGRDLKAMGEAYEQMGFHLTPVSQHSGSLRAGGPVEPMGTGNRCAMFRDGYLELLAIVDAAKNVDRVEVFLAKYTGLHIMAFRCEDSPAAERHLVEAGFDVQGAHLLQRMLETPDGEQLARFRNLRLPENEIPEGHVIVIKHETPELLWQPHLLTHPNGARALNELLVCVADPDEAASRFSRLFGLTSEGAGERITFHLPRGRFVLVSPARLASELPGATAPTLPFAAAFTVTVDDLGATKSLLSDNGVPFAKGEGGRLIVPASAGCGAAVIFESA